MSFSFTGSTEADHQRYPACDEQEQEYRGGDRQGQ